MLAQKTNHSEIYDPRELHILGDVFDAAWVHIGPDLSAKATSVEAARTKLAGVVLQVAQDGVEGPEEMFERVMAVMFEAPTEL